MSELGVDAIAKLAESLPMNDSHRKAKLDFSELPGGVKVDSLSGAELGRALKKLKIPGADPSGSRETNKAVYENFLQGIADESAETALLLWFLDNEDDDGKNDSKDSDVRD